MSDKVETAGDSSSHHMPTHTLGSIMRSPEATAHADACIPWLVGKSGRFELGPVANICLANTMNYVLDLFFLGVHDEKITYEIHSMFSASEALLASHKAAGRHNLFFAVMVPSEHSAEFTGRFQNFQKIYPFRGKPIGADRLHLSVYAAYRGDDLPNEVVQVAIQTGDAIRFAPFSLSFDTALTYRNRRSKMPFVLAAKENTEAVNGLRLQIGSAYSRKRGGASYRHRPISPHVTLIWDNIIVPTQQIEPVSMIVQEFALVDSHIGKSRYEIVRRWPLVRF